MMMLVLEDQKKALCVMIMIEKVVCGDPWMSPPTNRLLFYSRCRPSPPSPIGICSGDGRQVGLVAWTKPRSCCLSCPVCPVQGGQVRSTLSLSLSCRDAPPVAAPETSAKTSDAAAVLSGGVGAVGA